GNQNQSSEISVQVKALGETPGDLGATCATDSECSNDGFCLRDNGRNMNVCTRNCDDGGMSCPSGFQCIDSGGSRLCALKGGDGGGCSVGSTEDGFGIWPAALILAIAALARTRTRIRTRTRT